MNDNGQKDLEQQKKLQWKLQELLEKCKEKDCDCAEKLGVFVNRAIHSQKEYSVWEGIITEIIDSM